MTGTARPLGQGINLFFRFGILNPLCSQQFGLFRHFMDIENVTFLLLPVEPQIKIADLWRRHMKNENKFSRKHLFLYKK